MVKCSWYMCNIRSKQWCVAAVCYCYSFFLFVIVTFHCYHSLHFFVFVIVVILIFLALDCVGGARNGVLRVSHVTFCCFYWLLCYCYHLFLLLSIVLLSSVHLIYVQRNDALQPCVTMRKWIPSVFYSSHHHHNHLRDQNQNNGLVQQLWKREYFIWSVSALQRHHEKCFSMSCNAPHPPGASNH